MKVDQVLQISEKNGGGLSGRPLTLARDQLELWLMFRPASLRETVEFFALGGARDGLPEAVQVTPFFRVNGYSGYTYRVSGDTYGEVGFAPLRWGGFVTRKFLSDPTGSREVFEIYGPSGDVNSVDSSLHLELLLTELTEMDPRCPILSHLYGYLAHEYKLAKSGQSNTRQIAAVELLVRGLRIPPLRRDPAVVRLWERMLAGEHDQVLAWDERQRYIETLLAERELLVSTKVRAHRLPRFRTRLGLWLGDWANRARRVWLRPASNLKGFAYKYTIGLLIWFIDMVRDNIGYSIALALYGPFTFYFITQPLNPHAMWAVGRVRTAYLETTDKLQAMLAGAGGTASAGNNHGISRVQGLGGGGSAAVQALSLSPSASTQSQVDGLQSQTMGTMAQGMPLAPANSSTNSYSFSFSPNIHLGMPLSTDYPAIDGQTWSDRMSAFKNMQIGYESNMEFAARMGRLEQMELQLNFSMIVDSTWLELERYLDHLGALKASLPRMSPELAKYLDDEQIRTRQAELYVWDKLLRYILDNPYLVMDQSKEQVYRDYYMGRSILLLRAMTNKLAARESGFQKPSDYQHLSAVADAFRKTRVEGDTIMERLARNSKLFAQPDHTDGTELRSYMKRQWEILYLLQNKAQEASNFGLQMYIWSVRNAVWLLQSLNSAKNRELTLLFDSGGKHRSEAAKEIRTQIEPLYEQLTHMMSLEFASIRPELSTRLANDIDASQRKVLIDSVESFIKDRETVLKGLVK